MYGRGLITWVNGYYSILFCCFSVSNLLMYPKKGKDMFVLVSNLAGYFNLPSANFERKVLDGHIKKKHKKIT